MNPVHVAWENETSRRPPDLPLLSMSETFNGRVHYLLRNRRDRSRYRFGRMGAPEDDSRKQRSRESSPDPVETWTQEEADEAHALLYSAVVRNSLRFADRLLEQPFVDINTVRFGENLLMTAIRHGHVDMCRFLIESGINFNATRTLLERKLNKDASKDFLNWYTVNCRQLAYEKGLFVIVHLIDYLNGELYPFVPVPDFTPRSREPRLGMFANVVSIPEDFFDETKPWRPHSTASSHRGPAIEVERSSSTQSSQEKVPLVRFSFNRPKTAQEDSLFAPLAPADLATLSGTRSQLSNRLTPVLGTRLASATSIPARSMTRSAAEISPRYRASPNSSTGGSLSATIRETKSSLLRKANNVNGSSHGLPQLSRKRKTSKIGLRDALLGACLESS